ncbi:hypothetical protein K438DRAFT_1747531 [Mycena galopus ATCC 62051]|nr:hypothetical protein K438DRAFT_1747531 [Mycena galopus ATCC 62051]
MSHQQPRHTHKKNVDTWASTSTSVSTHSFTPEDLMPNTEAEINCLIDTFVDKASQDLHRVYHTVMPVEPPSPIKRAHDLTLHQGKHSCHDYYVLEFLRPSTAAETPARRCAPAVGLLKTTPRITVGSAKVGFSSVATAVGGVGWGVIQTNIAEVTRPKGAARALA